MRAPRPLIAVAVLVVFGALGSCREGSQDQQLGAASRAKTAALQTASSQAAPEGTREATARAEQVCHLLQGGPAERRAACCGGAGGGHVEAECVRVLGAALGAGRVAIDADAVSRCSEALPKALAGCDWVTPGQPLPPAECRELAQGLVRAGGSCRSSLECAAPLHCEGSTPTEAGRCAPALPDGAACRAPSDTLASLLFARDLEQTHPSCAGACSLASHRCEQAAPKVAASTGPSTTDAERPGAARPGAAEPGESCRTDFDCQRGGCTSAGVCGAKCAVSMPDAARLSSLPTLALPRRSPGR